MPSRKITLFEKNKKIEIAKILNIFFDLVFLKIKNPAKHKTHQVLGYKKMMIIFDKIKNIKREISCCKKH